MQIVRHLLEDLARFSPDARIEEEVEVSGVSPATSCQIETIGSLLTSSRLAQLEDDNDSLDKRNDELIDALEKAKKYLEDKKPVAALEVLEKIT